MSLKFERPFATVVAVSTANSEGTSPLSARADHVHAHEATHVLHDTAWAAKGDILGGSANDTALVLTVGADDTILMADAAAATGLKWVASASPSAVGTAAATGTSDTFTRGDHVHAHETGHVVHDTIWDAKGDLAAGTGADTASALTVGANDTILMADSAAGTGLKWVASATPGNSAVGDVAAVGTADTFTRGDHVHGREAFAAPTGIALANASGAATTINRSDHVHAHGSIAGTSAVHPDLALLVSFVSGAKWYTD